MARQSRIAAARPWFRASRFTFAAIMRSMDLDLAIRLLTGGEEGIREWNRRIESGDRIPSLRGVNLGDADLADTGLEHAQLAGANLSGTDLAAARLSGANLRRADLRDADLSDAEMICTDLSEADLRGASLSGADLGGASLPGARLNGADLEEADLSGANLSGSDLSDADLEGANLDQASLLTANLHNACLVEAKLTHARLTGANLSAADLSRAVLADADLRGTNLSDALLSFSDFRRTDLEGADLQRTILVQTDLAGANLNGCAVHGMAAWDINLNGASELNLRVSRSGEPAVCVDHLEVGQFLNHLLHGDRVRDMVRATMPDAVLILGRFDLKREPVLESVRAALRLAKLTPISVNYEQLGMTSRTETALTLARLCRFTLIDLTGTEPLRPMLDEIMKTAARISLLPITSAGATDEKWPTAMTPSPLILPVHVYSNATDLGSALSSHLIPAAAALATARTDHG